MKKWLVILFILSLILNFIQFGFSFWSAPSFIYSQNYINEKNLSLDDFISLNKFLENNDIVALTGPIENGVQLLIPHQTKDKKNTEGVIVVFENELKRIKSKPSK